MKKIFSILLVLASLNSFASHIVGGEIIDTCLGNNIYRFTFNMYRDCLPPSQGGGSPTALMDDDPAFLTIFVGNQFFSFDSVYASSSLIVPVNFNNDCINNPPATCINRLQFILFKQLPPSNLPYTLICQRCCRNGSLNNIINPGATGASYTCTIPPSPIVCNNSAIYKNYPPQIICINNPFVYDHSATDTDGDSLTYEFCNAIEGGDQNVPKPILIGGSLPALQNVSYSSPFSAQNPLGGNPILQIDPLTGIITGTPNIQGRFVVNVCCSEWRNGALINVVKREFQFVVTNCSKAVVANIPQYSSEPNTYIVSCKSNTVHFVNQSTGGFKYFWDFGVAGTSADTSILFEPTFTYPDTGTYIVKLIVNKETNCRDSISRIVKVYPNFKADFSYTGLLCPDLPISFLDKSTSTLSAPNYWSWNFGDGGTSNLQNPTNTYPNDGKDNLVTLVSGNSYGCRDTTSALLKIPVVSIFAGNDTVIVKNEQIKFKATGASSFTWTPSNYLDNPNVYNPIGSYPDVGTNTYIVQGTTVNGCVGYDTITVYVSEGPYITLPNAFTPNNDGNNDFFRILASGFKKLNTFKVYNRWGQLVFSTTYFRKGWDGRFNGRDCEVGTYYWVVTATDLEDKEKMIKGDVSLIR